MTSLSLPLAIHTVGFLLGGALNIFLVFFVFFTTKGKRTLATYLSMGIFSGVSVFQISHALGVIAPTADISRQILMWNLVDIVFITFTTHWILVLINKAWDRRYTVALIYITAILQLGYFLTHPTDFLLDSVPMMYFPFYYNAGLYDWVTRLWFIVVGIYGFAELLFTYIKTTNPVDKNRQRYLLIACLWGFFLGDTAVLLIYGVQFNPAWSSLFGLYTVVLAYAMVKHELLDIKILAKRAFGYAAIIATVAVLVTGISFANDYVNTWYPEIPRWVGNVIVGVIVACLGIFVWLKTREADVLKYQFINVVTHKFRTPLTRIKWSLDALSDAGLDQNIKESLDVIRHSNVQLVELTNTLTTLNDSDAASHMYQYNKVSFAEVVRNTLRSYENEYKNKHVTLTSKITDDETGVVIDAPKVQFVLQIVLDNALIYTPQNGKVSVVLERQGGDVVMKVTDSGIGFAKSHQHYMFTKFYRSPNARTTDTEGTGIGLFMAKAILNRNRGKIAISSEGEGKGTTVTISFPLA